MIIAETSKVDPSLIIHSDIIYGVKNKDLVEIAKQRASEVIEKVDLKEYLLKKGWKYGIFGLRVQTKRKKHLALKVKLLTKHNIPQYVLVSVHSSEIMRDFENNDGRLFYETYTE